MVFPEAIADLLMIGSIVVLPVAVLGFMVYVTYVARKSNKNNKKEK